MSENLSYFEQTTLSISVLFALPFEPASGTGDIVRGYFEEKSFEKKPGVVAAGRISVGRSERGSEFPPIEAGGGFQRRSGS